MTPQKLEGVSLGKYQLREQLGHGGMASVYRAYHPQLDRFVAVKVLRGELVEDEEFLTRFQREAKIVAALRHPNIVQVFDADTQDGVYYMVMELLDGDTLKARLDEYRARGETMPSGEVARILLDVLDGLAYAHGEGMIHRDIKPANIMLTRRGQAVITDFGIAQMIGGTRHTLSGALMGTLNYMAPEQGMQNQSDARSDLYSLGIVFYEMLTGHPPFDADTPLAILMKHVNEPLPLPSAIGISLPASFERVLLKVLSKNPDDRYQSAAEMAQAIRSAAEEAQVQLPDRISLPLSFSTAAAPSEPVSVISGTARENLTNTDFAKDKTDADLGQKLPGGQAGGAQAAAVETNQIDWWGLTRKYGLIALIAVGIFLVANLIFIGVAGITGRLDIFVAGWPLQVLVVGLVLSYVLFATRWLWMIVPASAVLTTGMLLSYYWFTNSWRNWMFWLIQISVLGILIVLVVIVYLTNRPFGRRVAYYTGLAFMALSATAIVTGAVLIAANPALMPGLTGSPFMNDINDVIQRSIDQGLQRGLRNVPTFRNFNPIATPTPAP